jgi:putative DNA primase/helicase
MMATGERCAVDSMGAKYEETEKRLIGSALNGFPIIALDNVREGLEGDFFCQITERPLMNLRALGKSDKHRIVNTFTMFCNGNNASVAEDMVRRTVRCAFDANMEAPETREFKGDPLGAIQKARGKYIAAALTIPLAYMAAGRPGAKPPLSSFEDWSRVVRDPLVWLGCGDAVAT